MSETDDRLYGGRYHLQRGIARGGMADVFLAHDRLLDRPVALKILFPELSSDHSFVERFRREAQAAANLSHPNIVSVFDWGEEDDVYYIVMEYVDGRPLSQAIRTEGRLLADRAADIGSETAAALHAAHEAGVIHRDVKPSNVLIREDGSVKVTDFGIARAVSATEGLTQTGAVMGTATYFSPEQAQGHAVDRRSDVYSLGVVLFEMVAGHPPFTGDSPVSVAYKHVKEDAPPLRSLAPDVPPAFAQIVAKAMAKNPANRYQSASELRDDLRRFRDGRSVVAEPLAPAPMASPYPGDPTMAQAPIGATQAVPTTDPTSALPPYQAPTPPTPNRTGVYVGVLAALLVLLAAVIFGLVTLLGGGDDSVQVTVPSVFGFTEEQAVQELEKLGLEVESSYESNDAEEAGTVFDQDPDGGSLVAEGSTIVIKVSQGAAPVALPDVVGDDVDDATDELEALDLIVTTAPQADDEAEVGTVLGMDPAAGTEVPPGTTVTLTVSSGREAVEIPDVSGKSQLEAANILGQAGFAVKTAEDFSETVDEGDVIRTDPEAGAIAEKGSEVTIIVSKGSEQVQVPSVVGMTEDDAKAAIEEAGLRWQVVEQLSSPAEDGQVIDQDPNGGTMAKRNSVVTITVGRFGGGSGDDPTTTTSP